MAKKHRSVSAAQKAGSLYFYDKKGVKKLAVTAEQLNAWKKKNKGKYKGNALTAWANNKGKNIGETGVTKSLRPKLRPKEKTSVPFKEAARDKTTTDRSRPKGQGADPFGFKTKKDKPGAPKPDNTSSSPATRGNKDKSGPRAEVKRRAENKNKSPDELNTESFDSVKRTDRRGVSLTREELKAMNEAYPRNKMNKGGLPMVNKGGKMVPFYAADGIGKMNKGGMTKKGVMTYNIGGMVKSQTNNLKKGRS